VPIYEYECTNCGRITEALQKFSDSPLTDCPHCHGKMHKLVSLSTFHLKGTGWYVTDYAGKNAGNRASKESSSQESAGSSTTAKANKETKTDN